MKKLLFLLIALYSVTGLAQPTYQEPADDRQSWSLSFAPDSIGDAFYPTPEALAATYDKNNTLSADIHQKVFNLYEAKDWKNLEAFFNSQSLNGGWPPAYGGYNTAVVEIKKGQVFDRYQENFNPKQLVDGQPLLTGTFFSPIVDGKSLPYPERALKVPEDASSLYYTVEVLQDLTFSGETATIIPWFNEPGNGTQVKWNVPLDGAYPKSLTQLALEGKIKITIVSSPNEKYSDLAGKTIP